MKRIISEGIILAAAAAVSLPVSADTPGVKVEHLGVNNTLVRVDGDARYLLMPVQEANDDARINILVDGKLDRTMYVRLAKSKTDYMVPFDLTPYKGKNVVLNILTSQGRTSVREASNDACWSNFVLADTFDTANREKYRPAFHHTPLYGWMNDPNGMVYKDGVWTLCYQWNPYGSKWQNMTWGRSTSTDLVNWTHHDAAILPDGLGTIFSLIGSAAGTAKDAIDRLREQGEKVGLIKIRLFRPFPAKEIAEALKNAEAIAIMDRAEGYTNHGGPLGADVMAALFRAKSTAYAINIVYGLGGRDVRVEDMEKVFADLKQVIDDNDAGETYRYMGIRE